MAKFDRVGGGSFSVFRKRPDGSFPWGGVVVIAVIIMMIAAN